MPPEDKIMFDIQNRTVREIAIDTPVTTRVFEEFKIDYCCHGNTPFEEACRNVGADPAVVIIEISDIVGKPVDDTSGNFAEVSLSGLIDHIVETHHVYTKNEMAHLTPLMAKVASRHGEHYPYLNELKDLFQEVCDDLGPHMMKEEMVLFPYVKTLEHRHQNNLTPSLPPFGTVAHPINVMNIEHETVGDLLSKMREITSDYRLPDDVCPSFIALFHRLAEFERDIHQHIHLENNILFSKAIGLERSVFAPAGS
jgi:regulator of cell morphogenesis and NO signaling